MDSEPRLLIVEDEMVVQLHLQTIVRELGYSATTVASTADEALSCAASRPPDLALMDIRLGGDPDGIEVARQLRNRHGVGVIFVTAYADEETVARTQEVGAVGYVVKPFCKPQIRAALSTAWTKHQDATTRTAGRPSSPPEPEPPAGAVVVTGTDGCITFLNRQATIITGWSNNAAIGKSVLEVVKLSSRDTAAILERVLATPQHQRSTQPISGAELTRRDGSERRVSGEVHPLARGDGNSGGLVITLQEARELSANDEPPVADTPERFGPRTRMVIYSHDTFGLGHLKRSLNIARDLVARSPGLSILLVTGSPAAHRFQLPPGVDYVKLPAVRKAGDEDYAARSLGLSDAGVLKLRSNLLLRSIQDYDPHVLLVDHAPIGMKGEMLPALEWLQSNRPATIKLMGLRDIIDAPDAVVENWQKAGIYDHLSELYDHILVYGSRHVFDLPKAYGFSAELRAKTRFCNYVCEPASSADQAPGIASATTRPLVVVTIGGGDGAAQTVIGNYLEMLQRFAAQIDFDSLILAGPLLPEQRRRSFESMVQGLPATIEEFVPSTSPYMHRADLVISTGGYNTMTQMLRFAKQALVIPRVLHRKEQLTRATRLAELGLINMLHPDELTLDRLYDMVTSMLTSPAGSLAEARTRGTIEFNGGQCVAEVCARLFATPDHA